MFTLSCYLSVENKAVAHKLWLRTDSDVLWTITRGGSSHLASVNRIGQLDRWECPSLSTKDDRGETKRVSSALCYNGAVQQEVDVGSTKV